LVYFLTHVTPITLSMNFIHEINDGGDLSPHWQW